MKAGFHDKNLPHLENGWPREALNAFERNLICRKKNSIQESFFCPSRLCSWTGECEKYPSQVLIYPPRRNSATPTTSSYMPCAGVNGRAQLPGNAKSITALVPLGYLWLSSSSCLPWVCIPSWDTGYGTSIAALPAPR